MVRWFIPYGIVRHFHLNGEIYPRSSAAFIVSPFISSLRAYVNTNTGFQFEKTSSFDTIISVQGLGFSGSGAVIDLLREYESVSVMGGVDYDGSLTDKNDSLEEINLLRIAGGLFEVERYIGSHNIFQNDALLHRVAAQIESSELYRKLEKTHIPFFEFFSHICYFFCNTPSFQYFNSFLNYNVGNDILFLKEFTVEEYRHYCRSLLQSLFSIIREDSPNKVLVLDQLTTDFEYNYSVYCQYITNLKTIVVIRDPRDVYIYSIVNGIEWIPHDNVSEYLYWYKYLTKGLDVLERHKYLVVQYERLVNDYDVVVKGIESFLGLDSNNHSRGCHSFDPSVSMNNVGLWKNHNEYSNDFSRIYSELQEFCY